MSNQTQVGIQNVQDIFQKKLAIPDYQRPYRWQSKHIKQLVDDIHSYFIKDKNVVCRLGTIVLHKNGSSYDIVDGQQRLTSLFLLLYVLNDQSFNSNGFLEQKFNHSQSVANISNNHQFLEKYIEDLGCADADFKKYILEQCDFAVVELENLDEAFQYFDSQNSRGKSLEAYDLLKAYHLREMVGVDKPAIQSTVEQWERAITHPISLKLIINDILYRHREWGRFRSAEYFDGQKVDIFKGIKSKDKDGHIQTLLRHLSSPDMSMPMFDGVGFFDYIAHYRQLYGSLFDDGGLVNNEQIALSDKNNEPLYQTLQANTGRVGDFYLFTLFRIMVMAYYDKFGDYELKRAVRKIAQWVYRLRLEKTRVSFATIENYGMKDISIAFHDGDCQQMNSLYNVIRCASTPDEVLDFQINQIKQVNIEFKNAEYAEQLLSGLVINKSGEKQ